MPTHSDNPSDVAENPVVDIDEAIDETIDSAEEAVNTAADQAKEYYDRLLRVSAELDNYKKRVDREMIDFRKYASERVFQALLPIIDNFERALAAAEEDPTNTKQLLEGLELIHNDLIKMLDQFNVTPINALGKPFDPQYHQAMMRQESADIDPNMVVSEITKGYMFHDRLLRPSCVIVSTEPTKPSE